MQLLFLKQGTIILYSCKHSTGFYGVLNQTKIKTYEKTKSILSMQLLYRRFGC